MNSRDVYIRKMQAILEEWNGEIDTLTDTLLQISCTLTNYRVL